MAVAFRRIQIGKEATRGTGVAATSKLIGTMRATPQKKWHRPAEDRNSLSEFRRQALIGQRCRLAFEGDATYEQIIAFLLMGIKGAVTPTTPVGTVRLWTFTPNYATANAPDTYTFEWGDDTQEYEATFCMVESIELTWSEDSPVTMRVNMFGRFPSKSSFTGALSETSVEEVVANKLKVYIDGAWANLGTTQKSSLVTGGTIRITTGYVPTKYADGSQDFSSYQEQKRHVEIELDMVTSTAFNTEYDAWVAGTLRAIRLQFDGTTIEGAHDKYLRVDVIGKYDVEPDMFEDVNGDNVVKLKLVSMTDGTNEFSFEVKNAVTAAP